MVKFLVGVVLGVVLVMAAVYFYFAKGFAPVAVTDSPMPMEHKFAHMALDAYLDKQQKTVPAVPVDEPNLLAGAEVYKQHCAMCHGLPGREKSAIAEGMYPPPPQLFRGTGVTDDPAWETYWK